MCGIAGILNFNGGPVEKSSIEAMTGRLSHRGPDGQGMYIESSVALGHTRLAIIDPDGGRQPMSTTNGRTWITYNGELYNYRELRSELQAAGYGFRTSSDTEVVANAWDHWRDECVKRFRGMFAFAIADWNDRILFLARDHLGIKPLYYFFDRRRFAFASELQALRALPDFPGQVDPRALDNYLSYQYVPPPRTIFKGVRKLPPATCMAVGFDGKTEEPKTFWTLRFTPQQGRTTVEWTDALETVLRESVEAHLVSDVPFGALLSGGLDSAAVVGFMSEAHSRPVKTFSIGFAERDFDELPYARQVAKTWKTDHHEEIVRPDALSILPELVAHYGEPFGDSSAIPTYYVSRLARRRVAMVLTGDGGDEALFGYGRYLGWLRSLNPRPPQRIWYKRLLRPAFRRALPKRFPADTSRRSADPAEWFRWMVAIDKQMRHRLWRQDYLASCDKPIEAFDEVADMARGIPEESFGQYVDYRTYLPHDILTKVDIASMCHGLEARTPLADVRVAEFAATIPWYVNVKRSADGQYHGKQLIKRILRRHYPTDFVERKKSGFVVPLKRWFSNDGPLREELDERLRHLRAHIYEYFEPAEVSHLIDTHGRNGTNNAQALWQLLFLEYWLEHARADSRRSQAAFAS